MSKFEKIERFFQISSVITILYGLIITSFNSIKLVMILLILSVVNLAGLRIVEKIKPIREEDDKE